MVLNETEDYNTVGLCYSLQNQDKHSTVIPLSTSLLIQSIPDFKGSAVASSLKSICHYFSIVGFISCFILDVAEGVWLSCRRDGLQDTWLATASRTADCFVSVQ